MYFHHVVLVYGAPAKLLTDQGREFDNVLLHTLCTLIGTEKIRTSAKHPQSNGEVERFNRTLAVSLSMYIEGTHKSWDRYVQKVAYAYNTSVHATTGFSPFFLMFGREPFSLFDRWILPEQVLPTDAGTYVENMRKQLDEAYANVSKAIASAKLVAKDNYDRKENCVPYKINDLVLLYSDAAKPGTAHKFNNYFSDPKMIVEVLGNHLYKIRDQAKPRAKPEIVHFNRLKPFFARENDEPLSQQLRSIDGAAS